MFHRFGDNIINIIMESPKITVVGALDFENVDFLTITWDWTGSLS